MSVIGDVKAKIQDHLEAMDDGAGNLRFHSVSTIPVLDDIDAPFAEIFFGSGNYDSDVNGSLDYSLVMVIRVTFDEEDLAETIFEQVVKLWFNVANANEMTTLNVLDITPLDSIAPVVLPGGDRYIMDIKYSLTIRYSPYS